ncbi:MAG: aminopeptidase P N-terminal domain-containing protein [Flavobacteriales bacterium]|nr:aminopeptidase P N-terminal domain-containing protein [Flavobacteriales bacterium]
MIEKIFCVVCFSLCINYHFGQEIPAQKKLKSDVITIYDQDLLTATFHSERRQELRKRMAPNSVAIFLANPIRNRSNDINFEYHQDPNFYYFTGLNEPHALILIFKSPTKIDGKLVDEVVFMQEKDPETEVWDGKRYGTVGAQMILGIDLAKENQSFHKTKIDLNNFTSVYAGKIHNDIRDVPFKNGDLFDLRDKLLVKLDKVKEKQRNSELTMWCAELREKKTKEEMYLLEKAISITCDAQKEIMRALNPEMKEYQAEALVEFVFKNSGAEYPGFPSILGSGENSCILHYTSSRKPMMKNDLLVCDIGAEYHGYTADVTRTLPASGKFSYEQKTIYRIVLEAQQAGIDVCLDGNNFWDPNIAATTVLSQRMKELGIIHNSSELRRYFMHGTSHYLGLDVHDVGRYGKLEDKQVITVEPGIYIPEGSPCDKKWWNIGVRIEDDILITTGEPVNLSECAPRTVEAIEALMLEKSKFNN